MVDVEALYSSIPHQQGVAVLKHFLSQTHRDQKNIEFISLAMEFILTHNVFSFDGSHFLWVQSIVMGTCYAPSYTSGGVGKIIFG